MPQSLLFAINNEGRVYSLSTGGSVWREFMYLGLEFKKLSSVPHFLWAVGGDRQIYVHVHGLEIPIRVREEAYENERWLPLEGFSSRLLPTDRFNFSSADGTVDRSIKKIRLPSMAWQWEGDWQLELSLDGQPLDHDGWSYAVDFPSQYGTAKQWKSCVRRRKWIRYRRYSALHSWCAIAPLHKDATEEPFIDIAIGGHQIPHAAAGTLLVWAITAHGRVMFRKGVSTTSPEGLRWSNIAIPPSSEMKQISVGPTGLVWALLWSGRILVRNGVTKDCLTGESWLEVKTPDDIKLSVISVGCDAIWVLGNDGSVWFRKGINGTGAGSNESCAIGKGWVGIGGNMAHISVTATDQVFSVGALDRCLYWRSGVTPSELSGKRWRMLQAPFHLSRASSSASLTKSSPKNKHRSLTSLSHNIVEEIKANDQPGSWEESRSAPIQRMLPIKPPNLTNSNCSSRTTSECDDSNEIHQADVTGKSFETMLKNPRAWSPVRSVGSVLGMEAHPESDSSVFDHDSGLYGDDDTDHAAWDDSDAIWSTVEAGGCLMDISQLPHWFADVHNASSIDLSASWRIQLLNDLKNRSASDSIRNLTDYQIAIDEKCWSRNCEARLVKNNATAEDCVISLIWHASESSGTLTVLNPDGATIKFILILNEILCVTSSSEAACPCLLILCPGRFKKAIKIQFTSDTDYEEWLRILVDVLNQAHKLRGTPSTSSFWGITNLGEVISWDPKMNTYILGNDDLYIKEIDVYGKDATQGFTTALYNCFGLNSVIEIKGCFFEPVQRLRIDLQHFAHIKQNHKTELEVRDIPLHCDIRFADKAIVRNSKKNSEWAQEERDWESSLLPGQDFNIKITCVKQGFLIEVNKKELPIFEHRLPPETASILNISGEAKLFQVTYKSKNVIIGTDEIVWRLMGGHLRKVETCFNGVTWGVSHDNSPWVYTGGWGGGFLTGYAKSEFGINQMTDTQNYFVYENQRWNPLTGYTSAGLPTDRHMWSDITGKHKRTRELTKLHNRHWHWVSEWIVDFHTPGGVDKEGWQYATDFPAPYHSRKLFTDCVRRRRWFRRAQLNMTGPWQRVGNTSIVDVSLSVFEDSLLKTATTNIWAVANTGDALYRKGVTKETPAGLSWEHVVSSQPLSNISIHHNFVWAVGRKGEVYFRTGMSDDNPTGTKWNMLEVGQGMASLKSLSVGPSCLWAVDIMGRLALRRGLTHENPDGTHWQLLPIDVPDGSAGFKHVSVGSHEVWAVTSNGALCRRIGVSNGYPAGTGWQICLDANLIYFTARGDNSILKPANVQPDQDEFKRPAVKVFSRKSFIVQ